MIITQDFIPKSRKMNRPAYPMVPEFITVHDVGNPRVGANAAMHIKYLNENADVAKRNVSWHFTADESMIAQHLPTNESAWHAGDGGSGTGNRKSIGVEICDNVDGDRAKAEENAIWLVAKLMKDHNIPIENVVQHNRWSGKGCPGILRSRPNGWNEFIAKINERLNPVVNYQLDPDDANKIIRFLSAGWFVVQGTSEAEKEFGRLANELRKASGQALK